MRPLTPWAARAIELLTDGQWHPRTDIVNQIMPLIPPGHATRLTTHNRNRVRLVPDRPQPRGRPPSDPAVVGARHIATHTLDSKRFQLEHGLIVLVRLRPKDPT